MQYINCANKLTGTAFQVVIFLKEHPISLDTCTPYVPGKKVPRIKLDMIIDVKVLDITTVHMIPRWSA